jgi:hypothetical protein
MPKRSTRITLSNNTLFTLTLVGSAQLCHGKWTAGWQPPPAHIQSKTSGSWQSESGGDIPIIGDIATGTEGWVKYEITAGPASADGPPTPELVYVHWDNPYVWAGGTNPCEFSVTTNDKPPKSLPCNSDQAVWSGGTFGGVATAATNEIFIAAASDGQGHSFDFGTGPVGEAWDFAAAVIWPPVWVVFIQDLQNDINLDITLGLRAVGSVDQTIFAFYDGRKGLRALARTAGQPSLKKLFSLR